MWTKFKNWVLSHKGLAPLLIILTAIIIAGVVNLLIYYKAPISLNDSEDKAKLVQMAEKQNPNTSITNVSLHGGAPFPTITDSLYKASDKLSDANDIVNYCRTLIYDAVNDSDTVHCITIFEIKEKFLREDVGKHLITIKTPVKRK